MAIEETRKKITWVPFEIRKGCVVDDSPAPTVTIKKGIMRFNKLLIAETNLNGKFVKFFYDPIKCVIGWQVKEEVNLAVVGKMWKMVKQNPEAGIWSVSITKLLDMIDPKYKEKSWYKLPVKKYVEPYGMEKGAVYYFVELFNEADDDGKSTEKKNEETAEKHLDTALDKITA